MRGCTTSSTDEREHSGIPHNPQGDTMSDRSPKSKAKAKKQKESEHNRVMQKAQADREARAVNSEKPRK